MIVGKKKLFLCKVILILALLFQFTSLKAQLTYNINGCLQDEHGAHLGFATVALFDLSDTTLLTGTITDGDGQFSLNYNNSGRYQLSLSMIGYETLSFVVVLQDCVLIDVGFLVMRSSRIQLSEIDIVSERLTASQNIDKTVFAVTTKMQKATSTGIDVIKLVPGVNVDLFQNISINGDNNIIIKVNGMEQSASFVNQLSSDVIDKIELSTNPGVMHSSNISGVLNIVLKENHEDGVSINVYGEIPTKKAEIYSFPAASVSYRVKKIALYASYNGNYHYFNTCSKNIRTTKFPNEGVKIYKIQTALQRSWSHKLNLGIDYSISDNNLFNFYTYINPFSNEFDGLVRISKIRANSPPEYYDFLRNDQDENRIFFASMYFKHLINNSSKSLSLDINYFTSSSNSSSILCDLDSYESYRNSLNPINNKLYARLKMYLPIRSKLRLDAGIEENFQRLADVEWSSFSHRSFVFTTYVKMSYLMKKFKMNYGLRVEHEKVLTKEYKNRSNLYFLPNFNINYIWTEKRQTKLYYKKMVKRPSVAVDFP